MTQRPVALKPARSEDTLTPEDQEEYLRKAREYFDTLAPRRARKPRRSESDDDAQEILVAVPTEIPELKVLAQLKKSGEVILKGKVTVVDPDEHEETGYYKCIETSIEHSVLGTGFIQLGMKQELPLKQELNSAHNKIFYETKTNPATNEWIPEPAKN